MAEESARRESEPPPKQWPELDPYPKSSLASESELQDVAEKLEKFRSLVQGHRMIAMPPGALSEAIIKRLEEDPLADEGRRYHAERDRRIRVLMAWYGNAVRRTDGADPQDLFILANLALIRDPEREPV